MTSEFFEAAPGDAHGVPPSPTSRVDPGRLWSGGLATAVVAALIGLVGVLIVRAVLHIAWGAAASVGAFGDGSTVLLCLVAVAAALAATGLAHALLLTAPRPLSFFGWIAGLVTAAMVVLPFVEPGSLQEALATAVIHLVIGLAITSLVTGAAASALRSTRPPQAYR